MGEGGGMRIDLHITDATPKQALKLLELLNDIEHEEPTEKQPRKGKWGIPFHSQIKDGHDKLKINPEYTKALSLCKKWELPYADAMQRENCLVPKASGDDYHTEALPVVKCGSGPHWKEVIKNSVNPPHVPITGDSE
jgi:hypothetical protein